MSTINKDKAELRRLVESYGKKDVLNFVKHLNEDWEQDFAKEKAEREYWFNIQIKLYEDRFGKLGYSEREALQVLGNNLFLAGRKFERQYLKENGLIKDTNTSSENYEYDSEKYEELEDTVRNLQAPVTAAFHKQGINFEEFMTDDYDQDDDGYIWVSPDTLWNNGPVEDEFIRNNWMPRKDDIILAPALLINPETEDIIFLVGYEDEDSDQVEYKVQYTNPAQFAKDFKTMYNYAKTHRNESYDSVIKTMMNGAVKR